ncbi:creatinine amidohydrolase [Halorubrum sp. Ib24]|uniref:creatininase family protein n=1 Tax=Halorubrum sp. Ib24 TaxID=1383850 RepID=UPI000B989E3A|nr:creatininase family protein [Halorubrum sp. Ib24]OYR40815.1 creatinine amidohydrolase [Halorubrum sp. Ib24]
MHSLLDSPSTWASHTAREILDIADSDGSIAVIPVGSTEQHGHHLPVATDALLADAVAHLGADRVTGDVPVLVTPPVWSGYSPHHQSFGGTITLGFETLLNMLEDVATSVLDNGFDALLLVNGHGGNSPLISAATSTIGVAHPDAAVLGVTYFTLAAPFIDAIRDSDTGGMAHAGEFETSLMLHLYPDHVRTNEMDARPLEEPYDHALNDMFDDGQLSVYRPFNAYTDSGAIGAPEAASAAKGQALYEALGDEMEHLLQQIYDRPAPG